MIQSICAVLPCGDARESAADDRDGRPRWRRGSPGRRRHPRPMSSHRDQVRRRPRSTAVEEDGAHVRASRAPVADPGEVARGGSGRGSERVRRRRERRRGREQSRCRRTSAPPRRPRPAPAAPSRSTPAARPVRRRAEARAEHGEERGRRCRRRATDGRRSVSGRERARRRTRGGGTRSTARARRRPGAIMAGRAGQVALGGIVIDAASSRQSAGTPRCQPATQAPPGDRGQCGGSEPRERPPGRCRRRPGGGRRG